MTPNQQPTIVIIGDSSPFIYLIQRYADRIGYLTIVLLPPGSTETVFRFEPVAVIFSSVEILNVSQSLVADLANRDIPTIVCSSATDQIRTRELGADYCLLHPLTYDDFQAALTNVNAPKHA